MFWLIVAVFVGAPFVGRGIHRLIMGKDIYQTIMKADDTQSMLLSDDFDFRSEKSAVKRNSYYLGVMALLSIIIPVLCVVWLIEGEPVLFWVPLFFEVILLALSSFFVYRAICLKKSVVQDIQKEEEIIERVNQAMEKTAGK